MNLPRGRPFETGNKLGRGRPKGSRNKRTAQAQAILDQYTEPILKRCVAKALEGNPRVLGLCMERILPSPREPGVRIRMPKLEQIKDIDSALQRVFQGIANGNITPSAGEKIYAMLQNHRDNLERRALEARLTELEKLAEQQYPIQPRRGAT
jgi:hypothetical protein